MSAKRLKSTLIMEIAAPESGKNANWFRCQSSACYTNSSMLNRYMLRTQNPLLLKKWSFLLPKRTPEPLFGQNTCGFVFKWVNSESYVRKTTKIHYNHGNSGP